MEATASRKGARLPVDKKKGRDTPKDTLARAMAEMLTTLHGYTPPATCELCEVVPTVAMQGNAAPEFSPRRAHVGVGLGHDPLLQGLLANLKEHSAAALVLGAHDMHAL
jgi:hypothetical protein